MVNKTASVHTSATPKKNASKKTPASKTMASKVKPVKIRPSTSEMVDAAIAALKDRKGSSLQAIKKYIVSTYKVDLKNHSYLIKKYLKSSVEKNTIIQVKGTGASGRFKLPSKDKKVKMAKPADKKPANKAAVKKSIVKKTVGNKAVTKKQSINKPAKSVQSKIPSKTSKARKVPIVAKAKTPKPKKATASKSTKK